MTRPGVRRQPTGPSAVALGVGAVVAIAVILAVAGLLSAAIAQLALA